MQAELREATEKQKELGLSALEAKVAATVAVKAAERQRLQAMKSTTASVPPRDGRQRLGPRNDKFQEEFSKAARDLNTRATKEKVPQQETEPGPEPPKPRGWIEKDKQHHQTTQAAVERKLKANGMTPALQNRLLNASEAGPPPEEEPERPKLDKGELMRKRAARAAQSRRDQRAKEVVDLKAGIVQDDERWALFEEQVQAQGFSVGDIPVPAESVLSCDGAEDRGDRFKVLARRWHPDKFSNKFRTIMADGEEDAIMAEVQNTFQRLNEYKYVSL